MGNSPHKKIIRTLYVDNFILMCVRHAKALRATLSPTYGYSDEKRVLKHKNMILISISTISQHFAPKRRPWRADIYD